MARKKHLTSSHKSGRSNICFNCQKACGGCSWSAIDPNTGKPGFKPIPGWTAEPVVLNVGHCVNKGTYVQTYHITACPEFVPDAERKTNSLEMSDAAFGGWKKWLM